MNFVQSVTDIPELIALQQRAMGLRGLIALRPDDFYLLPLEADFCHIAPAPVAWEPGAWYGLVQHVGSAAQAQSERPRLDLSLIRRVQCTGIKTYPSAAALPPALLQHCIGLPQSSSDVARMLVARHGFSHGWRWEQYLMTPVAVGNFSVPESRSPDCPVAGANG